MRRSGKSVILNQIMDEIIKLGINKYNIIYINFESLKYDFIKSAKDLYNYIESLKVNDNKYYVFLDEIQKIDDLIGKDYKVFIGKTKKSEIDFIASKSNNFKYIQVCYDLSDENTRNREFSVFDGIEDSEKYIITLTKEEYSTIEVKQINIFDFLMNDDF